MGYHVSELRSQTLGPKRKEKRRSAKFFPTSKDAQRARRRNRRVDQVSSSAPEQVPRHTSCGNSRRKTLALAAQGFVFCPRLSNLSIMEHHTTIVVSNKYFKVMLKINRKGSFEKPCGWQKLLAPRQSHLHKTFWWVDLEIVHYRFMEVAIIHSNKWWPDVFWRRNPGS